MTRRMHIEDFLNEAIKTIQKHYKDKYNNDVLVPDSVEIMQRHPEIVSAIMSTLTENEILDHKSDMHRDKMFL